MKQDLKSEKMLIKSLLFLVNILLTDDTKMKEYFKLIKTIQADESIIKAEEERLYNRRKALENRRESIKNYLESTMLLMNIDKVKTPILTVSMQNNPPSVNVINEMEFKAKLFELDGNLEEYYIEQEPKLDKKKLLDTIKTGYHFPGVELKQTKGVRIK
jgi:hypothetical protein